MVACAVGGEERSGERLRAKVFKIKYKIISVFEIWRGREGVSELRYVSHNISLRS